MKMNTITKFFMALALSVVPMLLNAANAKDVLNMLDLSRPGLEKVRKLHARGKDKEAAAALLDYYRHRTGVKSVGVNAADPKITAEEQRWADEGLEHKFFVHTGYQPSFFYGKDINWQYWPVKDNELRWQLHRTKWWVPMGKAYRISGDEKYAAEWVAQYRDWIAKNPLTKFDGIRDKNLEDADNVYFAWRPLEVGDRLEHQIEQFELFLPSKNFTPEFLIDFLDNYHRHATFANSHYSAKGNHLLFEAQRIIFAGTFFPEFKEAKAWQQAGVDILNREITKQVYPDGQHFELDPGYHMACIGIFGKALEMMQANGCQDAFPPSFVPTLGRMAQATYNMTFPDGTLPVFSDNKLHKKAAMTKNFRSWTRFIKDDPALEYFATDGKKGQLPAYTSRAFKDGGFYVLRNGWDPTSTVMILKAGPHGEWHNQYDNGTFELWAGGRNYFPDSGSYIYGGDSTVLKQRQWFRDTRVHNTLTLDNRTIENRESKLLQWVNDPLLGTHVVVETPSYSGLTHRRAVFFVDRKFYVIVDEAYGDATGDVAIHYALCPGDVKTDSATMSLATAFPTGGNIALKVFGAHTLSPEEGWTSPAYREKTARPAFAFATPKKDAKPVRMITVIYPTADGAQAPAIEARFLQDFKPGHCKLEVSVDGKSYPLNYLLPVPKKPV